MSQETDPLDDSATPDNLTGLLNKWELQLDRRIVAIDAMGGINRATYEFDRRAKTLKRLRIEPVPASATGDTGKFADFISPLLATAEALCRAEVFINKQQTEVVLLREAEPFEPRASREEGTPATPATPATPVPPVQGASKVFMDFMPFIYEWEGETFENDPDDPGGATKFGIDQRSHPGVDIRNLTKDAATAIYWDEWNKDGCATKASPYAEVFFNCAVNMGLGRAKQFDKLTNANARDFLTTQEAYYKNLAQKGRFGKYLKGWLNRTTALRKRFGLF